MSIYRQALGEAVKAVGAETMLRHLLYIMLFDRTDDVSLSTAMAADISRKISSDISSHDITAVAKRIELTATARRIGLDIGYDMKRQCGCSVSSPPCRCYTPPQRYAGVK